MGTTDPLPPTKSMTASPALVRHHDHVMPTSQSRSTRVPFQDFLISVENALELSPDCVDINVRCAQGFMNLSLPHRDLALAKECLNKALNCAPNNFMVIHTAAKFYERHENNILEAKKFYQHASELGMFGAHMELVRLRYICDKVSYDPITDLEIALQKYQDVSSYRLETLMQMGSYHFFIEGDIENAFKCWEKVIDEDPDSEKLKPLAIGTLFTGLDSTQGRETEEKKHAAMKGFVWIQARITNKYHIFQAKDVLIPPRAVFAVSCLSRGLEKGVYPPPPRQPLHFYTTCWFWLGGSSKYGAVPECEGGGNERSPRKPADQWHRTAQFQHMKICVLQHQELNLVHLVGRQLSDHYITVAPLTEVVTQFSDVFLHEWQWWPIHEVHGHACLVHKRSSSGLLPERTIQQVSHPGTHSEWQGKLVLSVPIDKEYCRIVPDSCQLSACTNENPDMHKCRFLHMLKPINVYEVLCDESRLAMNSERDRMQGKESLYRQIIAKCVMHYPTCCKTSPLPRRKMVLAEVGEVSERYFRPGMRGRGRGRGSGREREGARDHCVGGRGKGRDECVGGEGRGYRGGERGISNRGGERVNGNKLTHIMKNTPVGDIATQAPVLTHIMKNTPVGDIAAQAPVLTHIMKNTPVGDIAAQAPVLTHIMKNTPVGDIAAQAPVLTRIMKNTPVGDIAAEAPELTHIMKNTPVGDIAAETPVLTHIMKNTPVGDIAAQAPVLTHIMKNTPVGDIAAQAPVLTRIMKNTPVGDIAAEAPELTHIMKNTPVGDIAAETPAPVLTHIMKNTPVGDIAAETPELTHIMKNTPVGDIAAQAPVLTRIMKNTPVGDIAAQAPVLTHIMKNTPVGDIAAQAPVLTRIMKNTPVGDIAAQAPVLTRIMKNTPVGDITAQAPVLTRIMKNTPVGDIAAQAPVLTHIMKNTPVGDIAPEAPVLTHIMKNTPVGDIAAQAPVLTRIMKNTPVGDIAAQAPVLTRIMKNTPVGDIAAQAPVLTHIMKNTPVGDIAAQAPVLTRIMKNTPVGDIAAQAPVLTHIMKNTPVGDIAAQAPVLTRIMKNTPVGDIAAEAPVLKHIMKNTPVGDIVAEAPVLTHIIMKNTPVTGKDHLSISDSTAKEDKEDFVKKVLVIKIAIPVIMATVTAEILLLTAISDVTKKDEEGLVKVEVITESTKLITMVDVAVEIPITIPDITVMKDECPMKTELIIEAAVPIMVTFTTREILVQAAITDITVIVAVLIVWMGETVAGVMETEVAGSMGIVATAEMGIRADAPTPREQNNNSVSCGNSCTMLEAR
ncbi:hypothetical protein PR048_033646 [Dryococelus australis]|uniref:Uncharacterized protein n=1 Tax=Dryococelus australis TaxID=614101 RepID=A0ABQ9G0W6_9NEOP|nr:hypothetical protein PR048_033646 [Dryococelus australis]